MTSDSISWLYRVSDVMSDLTNHTVMIHTRYQDISPVSGRALACVCACPLLCSVARTFHHDLPSTVLER